MAINRIDNASPARISTNFTVGKQTQTSSFGEKVNAGLQSGANALASGASLLGAAGVPGLGIVSAAVSSVTGHAGSGGVSSAGYAATGVVNVGGGGGGGGGPVNTTVGGTGGSLGSVGGATGGANFNQGSTSNDVGFGNQAIGGMSGDMSNMLKLQYSMQKENMMYTSISNVLKTKHDTTKNSISNVR